jgi:hypothetical protein
VILLTLMLRCSAPQSLEAWTMWPTLRGRYAAPQGEEESADAFSFAKARSQPDPLNHFRY